MAVLRVEFDIDGDVYPELHAALLALSSDASRAERLRQLAASGLVWEKIRIRGPAVVHGGPPEVFNAAALPSAPAAPAAALGGAPPARKPRPARPPAAAPMPEAMPPDFIDLALDAEPFHAPPPAPFQPSSPPSSPPASLRAPPVLMDVVEPEALTASQLTPQAPRQAPAAAPVRRAAAAPADLPSPASPALPSTLPGIGPKALPDAVQHALPDAVPSLMPNPATLPTVATLLAMSDPDPAAGPGAPSAPRPEAAVSGIEQPPPEHPPEPPLEHKPTTRSRLQRMKERGLFKNG